MTDNLLLNGVRVLDLSRLLPGPFCSLYLAQLGAEVIKIEEPDGGDYAREMPELFEQVNRGKQSITLDLRLEEDLHQFNALVKTADVVLESFRPGVMDGMNCGYEDLKKINPKLVYAALTGYGQTGPYRDWAGHDMNYLSIAGVLDQVGVDGGRPAQSNLQVADLAGGSLTCAIGILAALLGAQKSGTGSMVDVSMAEGAAALQVMALATLRKHGTTFPAGRDLLTGALPNYSIYKCRDGRYLAVGALEPKFFQRVLEALWAESPSALQSLTKTVAKTATKSLKQRKKKTVSSTTATVRKLSGDDAPEKESPFGKWAERLAHPVKARRLLAPLSIGLTGVFRTRDRDYWADLFSDKDACVTPVLTLEEAMQNEHFRERGLIGGTPDKREFNLPIKFSKALEPASASPSLGADNEVLFFPEKWQEQSEVTA